MRETKNKRKDLGGEEVIAADQRVYEVGYLLVPTIEEENVPKVYGDLKEVIISLGGQVISDEAPSLIPLAYTMQKVIANAYKKFDTGYFGWTKFYMNPEKAVALKKKLDLDTNIIRFLIVKTVKENTLSSKRFGPKDVIRKKATIDFKKSEGSEGAEEETTINKEEIDKEIDAMIAE